MSIIIPPVGADEADRLQALESLDLLDTPPEEEFDTIISLVQRILEVPIVLISLLDKNRQWFKACYGLDVTQTDRNIAFCAYAILQNTPFVVTDAILDERFKDNPLVTGEPFIRFYAGIPLQLDGFNIGTLCIIDKTPRDITHPQLEILKDFAATVVRLIERRQEARHLAQIQQAFREVSFQALRANGQNLFPALTGYLSQFLKVPFVAVSLLLPDQERVRSLAFYKNGQLLPSAEYDLANSPLGIIFEHKDFFYSQNLSQEFPLIEEFSQNRIQGFAGTNIFDNAGNCLGIVSILDTKPIKDIVLVKSLLEIVAVRLSAELQRTHLEEELRLSEQRYRVLAETASDGIISIDDKSIIQYVNPAGEAMFGYDQGELLNRPLTDLIPHNLRSAHQRGITDYLKSGHATINWKSVEVPGLHRTGNKIPLEISFGQASTGPSIQFTAVVRDITARKQMQEAINRSEGQYRALAQNFPNGLVLLFDLNKRIIIAGGSTFTKLGIDPKAIEGKKVTEVFYGVSDQISQYSFDTLTGKAVSFEIEFKGRIYFVQTLPVKNELGEIFAGMGVAQDMTLQRQAEEEIKVALSHEKELRELKSRFISVASHELRTPLTGILTSTEILEHYGERLSAEKRNTQFQRIKNRINHMVSLVNDVLIFNKSEQTSVEVNLERIDLRLFSQEIIEELSSERKVGQPEIKFEWDCNCEACHQFIETDPKLLRHILQNLLSNALKYAQGSATVNFKVNCTKSNLEFVVQDWGIGIPVQDQGNLFEPFYRASNTGKIPGTGLGLAIVKQYVDLLDGTINVTSSPQNGTIFKVGLVLKSTQPEKSLSLAAK